MSLLSRSQSSKSLIADIGEEEMLIALPMNTDLIGFLPVNTKIDITFVTDVTKYRFKPEILGRKKDNIPLFRVKKPLEKDIVKIQQRENFRVNANLRVLLKETEQRTVNISAGGLLCSCSQDLELVPNEEVPGTLFLPVADSNQIEAVDFKAQIIRTSEVPRAERMNVAMKFIEIDRESQTKVTQYCFEKQRQERMIARR